jgi:hypothetical protein
VQRTRKEHQDGSYPQERHSPGRSLEQSRTYFYYLMRRGGLSVDYRALREHQQVISRELGHHRIKITAAYLGQSAVMRRKPALRACGASEVASDST